MKITPFQPEHIERLRAQGIQTEQVSEMIGTTEAKALQQSGPAQTVVDGDRILCCSGVAMFWPGRGLAWAVFPNDLSALFIGVHRTAKRFLDGCGIRRVEADIRTDFSAAHRWIKLLGFEYEGTRRAFSTDGADYDLYARVRAD